MADVRARFGFAFFCFLIYVGAGSLNPPSVCAAPAPPNPAAKALAKYHALMASLPKPANMVFEYAEVRTGPTRIVSSLHRVYRDASGDQRNDTVSINDLPVRPPQTQTYQRATWPYFADQFDAPADTYDVTFTGVALVDGRKAYVYKAKRSTPAEFEIRQLALDPASGLPLRELYDASSSDCIGTGEIDFTQVGPYVLPASVSAECTIAGTGQYKHVIRFSNYSFPAAIPQDVLHPSGGSG